MVTKYMLIAVMAAVATCVYGGVVPVPAAAYAVAPFGSSYTAHSINHALAHPVAVPAVAKLAAPIVAAPAPLPVATAPYFAAASLPYATAYAHPAAYTYFAR